MSPARASPLPELYVRGASALVMVAVAALALWAGGWVLALFIGAIAAWLLWEWQTMIVRIALTPLARLAWTISGLAYIVGGAGAMLVLAEQNLVVPVIAIVVATDTGAYFTGRAIGGAKIAPAISPSKTWAGLFGGMVSAAVVAVVYAALMIVLVNAIGPTRPPVALVLSQPLVIGLAAVTGAVLAIIAQCGDFFESWMKRRAGVKDSGVMIPGHGGLFDRVDGLLPVAIACAALAQVMTHGAF